MLCKLLLFALLVSVYGDKKRPIVSPAVESGLISGGEAGPGLSNVAESQVSLGLGARLPPMAPLYPGPASNGHHGRPYVYECFKKLQQCESVEANLNTLCLVDSWVEINQACNGDDAMARTKYAECICRLR
ncbi:unnamed protein product [Cylicocyclus nassatus]|uniref:Uncharacterized protein n=1 Tax=Cylicocyclus nassatus TaxID=53992 RepID=A0AA36MD41_CYLNA|nr:unnamed protein product [Cylicocyclus nassatus]